MAIAALAILAASCSSAQKMVDQANNVKVTCDPAVLEAVAGDVTANLTVTYPANYFHPKAILEVTPVIVYEGGETKALPIVYQGQKVKDNYKAVAKNGGIAKERINVPFAKGMEQSHLELRGVVKYKNKSYKLPVRKVADGMNTTYMLVDNGLMPLKADGYEAIIKQTAEGQILYRINSADVRSKELKNQSIKDFQNALTEIKNNERKTLIGTEVVAYASPDGGESLNQKLSDERSKTADKAWSTVVKGHEDEVVDPEVKSIGQDWEGFQELVQNSDLEDKDLIIRVLSMYSDPAVRENEIKNLSNVYTDLKTNVLPELRRARFIANVEYKNYTTEELLQLINDNIDILDETALLHAATLVKGIKDKEKLYNMASSKFDSDVARFNLAATYFEEGDLAACEKALAKVENKDGDYTNALGAIALRKGDYDTAMKHFKKAGTAAAKSNIGISYILQGEYGKAVEALKDTKGCPTNKGLAYLLNGQLDKAAEVLSCQSERSNYVKAVVAARQGKSADVQKYLEVAKKDKALAERAKKDIEFAAYNK